MEYLALAKSGNNKWWAYLLSIVVILLVGMLLGSIPLEMYFEWGDKSNFTEEEWINLQLDWNFEALGLDKNIGLSMLIASFAFFLIALIFAIRVIHKRSFRTLINPAGKIRWNRIVFSVSIWVILMSLTILFDMIFDPDNYSVQFELRKFIPLLFVSLFLLPIQTSTEELFFRGYLLQAFSLLSKYPIISVTITSILFGLAHMPNPEVAAFGWPVMFTYYFCFAFALAVLTIWDNGIEIALGIHAANNIFGALTVTYSDAVIQTDAIWKLNDNHIGWGQVLIYIIFFSIVLYAYYYIFIKRASGHVIRS